MRYSSDCVHRARLASARIVFLVALFLAQPSLGESLRSPIEQYLNPFGDAWSLATHNPDIPLMAPFPCARSLPETFWRIPDEQHDFVTRLGAPLVWSGCTNVLALPYLVSDELKPQITLQRIAEFKDRHPGQLYLGYYDIAQFSIGVPAYKEISENHLEWFVHREGPASTPETIVRNRGGGKILDVTNPDFQRFIAEQIRISLDAYGMDGFLVDGVSPPLDQMTKERDLPPAVRDAWADGWLGLLKAVKEAIGPEKLVLANVNEAKTRMVRDVLRYADGVLLEDPLGPLAINLEKSGQRAFFEDAIAAAAAQDKYLINAVNTNVNRTTLETTSVELEHRYARYYTAAHLIFFQGRKTLMLYYTPSKSGVQYRSAPFFADWNLRVGEPRGGYQMIGPGVYSREFLHAHVYLNNSKTPYEVVFAGSLLTPEGRRVERYTMPAKSGMIFVDDDVVREAGD